MSVRANNALRVLTLATVLLAWQVALFASSLLHVQAQASTLQDRSLDLSSSRFALSNVTYEYIFTFTQSNSIGSIVFEICSNDPFPGTACTAPSGYDASSATLDVQQGETGFSIHANSTANRTVLGRTASNVTPQQVEYEFSSITNPDNQGSYYVRLTTHASEDGTGPIVDGAGLAFSINGGLGLSTEVPPYLLFCSSVNISGNNCASASGQKISFGSFSTDRTSTATSQMVVATNAENGVGIRVNGTTLTSGNNAIPALSSPDIALTGTSQFGMNLRNNNSPNVGSNPSGPGSATPTANYNGADLFYFKGNSLIASSNGTTDYSKFTVSYMVNISDEQAAGQYSTTLSYIALATF